MVEHILGATAVISVLINSLLAYYLLSDRHYEKAFEADKNEIVNFVLKPVQNKFILDTEILATEVIAGGVPGEGDGQYRSAKE